MRDRLIRLLRAAIGDDRTGAFWQRLTPAGRRVIRLAFLEARELGHPCLADEHLVLGLLRDGTNPAAAALRAHGLDLATARAELLRIGPTLGPRADPAAALRGLGIDIDQVRRHLENRFGTHALQSAERRVRRRPRWRGGHPRPNPLCAYLLTKRAFQIAARHAAQRGDPGIGPPHLLYGVLQDARDPLGTQLSRRSRTELATLGFAPGRPHPVRLMLEAYGINLSTIVTEIA
jgi:hypothetical protein